METLLGDGSRLIGPLEQALLAYSQGSASAPPRIAASSGRGLLAAMPAHVPGVGLAAKLVSIFPANRDLPSHQGMVALFDEQDGRLLCLMDGRPVTARRTAAVSAISVRRIGPPGALVLAVLGSGEQARAHVELLGPTFGEVRLAARNGERARELMASVGLCSLAASFEEAIKEADVVVACTGAMSPVVRRAWLKPGAHLVSVGSGPELEAAIVESATLFVEWRGAATCPPPAGAPDLQGVPAQRLTELGEVVAGMRPGRRSDRELTVFRSTGLGVEDAAVASHLYRLARAGGLGHAVEW